jgi:sugar O-acyltransferase (sialic acid O-acetyltransferase NeuD family)
LKKNEVIIIGAFSEVIELCEFNDIKIVGIFDNILTGSFMGYKILGNDTFAFDKVDKFNDVPIIVTSDMPEVREKLIIYYREAGYTFTCLIHKNAIISKYAKIGKGVVIQNGVNISSNAVIDDFVRINTNANIMHDSKIGKFTTVAPNAVILGRVEIEQCCYIGANSTILPSLKINQNTIVGAGSVVTKNVNKNKIVKGNPAR